MPVPQEYLDACDFRGTVNPERVEKALGQYLGALGLTRKIRRISTGWDFDSHPELLAYARELAEEISKRNPLAALDALDALDARDARDARAARAALDALDARAALDALDARAALDALDARAALDALDARDARAARAALDARDARAARAARAALDARAARAALMRLCAWGIGRGSWYYNWDTSWIATTVLGTEKPEITAWARPMYDAFVAGCWYLHWTKDTLFWVGWPTVHTERVGGQKRLHCATGPTLESDLENIYFWHGVLVPAHAVVEPETITVDEIKAETNAEVRRVLIERYGQSRYLMDSGAREIHRDDFGILYRQEIPGDEALVMVKVVNSTSGPDGSFKDYFLRVHPELRPLPPGEWDDPRKREWLAKQKPQEATAHAAVASTFGLRAEEYAPEIET